MPSRKYLRHLPIVAALALGGLALSSSPAAADDGAGGSVIIARGSGEVRVTPDSIRVDVGTEAQAATVDQAQRQVSAAMQRVVDALRALDLPGLTLETEQIRVSPVYGASRDASPAAIVAYSASNHVLVTAPHAPEAELAARSARIVDAALGAGASSLGSIDFFLADPSAAEEQALTLAVQNAASDAQTMAQAAGVTLAGPLSIEEASASHAPRALMLEAAVVSTPVEIGDITIRSDVTARYAFHG